MNVAPVHVKMVEPVLMQSMSTHAAVLQGMLETTVRQVSVMIHNVRDVKLMMMYRTTSFQLIMKICYATQWIHFLQ